MPSQFVYDGTLATAQLKIVGEGHLTSMTRVHVGLKRAWSAEALLADLAQVLFLEVE